MMLNHEGDVLSLSPTSGRQAGLPRPLLPTDTQVLLLFPCFNESPLLLLHNKLSQNLAAKTIIIYCLTVP